MAEFAVPRRDRSGYVWTVALYVAGLAVMVQALRHNVGFPLDDSWIHQVIARNLVEYHTWGFVPGKASSGSSSTLWTLVLSLQHVFAPKASEVWFPLALNAFCLIASGLMLFRMAEDDGLPRAERYALGLLPALSGNWLWLAFTGMEHVLFVTLALAGILLWFWQDRGPRPSLYAGLALGALTMTRPEGLILVVILFALSKQCGRTLADVVRAGLTSLVFLLPTFVISLKTSGALLPNTMRGRRFLYTGADKLHIGRAQTKMLLGQTYSRVVGHNLLGFTHAGAAATVATGIVVVLALYGTYVLLRRFPNRTAVLFAWSIVHYMTYCVVLPAIGHGGRYQPQVILLLPAAAAIGLIAIVRRVVKARDRAHWVPAEVVALALVGVLTALSVPRWEKGTRDAIADINGCHRQLAYWMNDHYAPGTKVGIFDIGAIAYFSHVDVVDLGGLVDKNFLPALLNGTVPEYLQAEGVNLVVLPHNPGEPGFGYSLHFLGNPSRRIVPVHTEGIDGGTWWNGDQYVQHAFRFETLYRMEQVPQAEQSAEATSAADRAAILAAPEKINDTHLEMRPGQ